MCIFRGYCFHFIFIAVGLLAMPAAWSASSTFELGMSEAEALALSEEPGQLALLARANALGEDAIAAGALPDPQLRAGVLNFPVESGGFTTEGMSQVQIGIRQAFPAGRSRSLSTKQLQSSAKEISAQANARERDVKMLVRQAWLEAHYWDQAHHIVSSSRPLFNDLVKITESLYAVGRKNQQELLRAELELSRLDDKLLTINQHQVQARAALSEWIGETHAKRPLAKPLPNLSAPPSFEALKSRLTDHPQLQSAAQQVSTQSIKTELAKQQYKPSWALDLNYGLRDGQLPNGDPRSDFLSGMVTFSLPIFTNSRQDRKVSSAKLNHRAALSSQTQLHRALLKQLEITYAQWETLNQRIDLYQRIITAQSQDQTKAALRAYQSDASDFADVMQSSITELEVQLDYARLKTEQAQSYATLANLGGLE